MEMAWWQRGIVYQVYPRSFQDTNGDGVGDLRGIAERLDYLVSLGVDAVWLSPIYPSPMADFGYDVADYCGIDPIFGTMADFDALVARAHGLGLKLILDFVPNHTSDQHPWFLDSSASRTSPHRDWYLWRDPAPDGGPPNNWLSNFGGLGWTLDERTGQYYYHSFLPQQPDLNWRNPAVRAAMADALRFWLNRGVDGFRVDVMWMMIKDDQFRDNPPNPDYTPGGSSHDRLIPLYTADRPEVHDVVAGLRRVLDEYPDRVMIGELYLPIDRLVTYYGPNLDGAQLPFNFQLLLSAWNAATIAAIIETYEAALPAGGWPNWVLGNHDRPRIASRIGAAQARVAAMLLLTLRGTPTIFYGEEIGMEDVPIPPAEVQDPAEKREPGRGLGRDPERTPMLWDGSSGHGFSTGTPWLRFGAQATDAARQAADPTSMLALYRELIALRRGSPALLHGRVAHVVADGDVLSYERHSDTQRLAIFLNLGETPRSIYTSAGKIILSTQGRGETLAGETTLGGSEAIVVEIRASDQP
ncbi:MULTISPECIES: alpha-amylase family glycosyl hydrolase [unclassified Acidisoma]|uniref:alpha-amylase family glycosyl hydrolase n=1 Tax=unclassified Acidisoma TaxID=2634065 RepID=UPI001C203606|nr:MULTISPECIES: alpha-amylase family glycosyl hydrolase [unclassified Acidisoma]